MIKSAGMKKSLGSTCALLLVSFLATSPTQASTFRSISLETLLDRSAFVVVATPVSANSHWAQLSAGKPRVVTDFTVEVAWTLRGEESTGKVMVVRTLGGTVGGLGQIVYGEAQLKIGQATLLFLAAGTDGSYTVTGMAQGQYPLEASTDGSWKVRASSGLDAIVETATDRSKSAVRLLSGRTLSEVPELIAVRGIR